MTGSTMNDFHGKHITGSKILLTILPYWSPIIPPVAIAALRGNFFNIGHI